VYSPNCVLEVIEENASLERETYWINFYKNTINTNNPTGMSDEEFKLRRRLNAKRHYEKIKLNEEKYKKRKEYMKKYYQNNKSKFNN
jgi:hypothetical protein